MAGGMPANSGVRESCPWHNGSVESERETRASTQAADADELLAAVDAAGAAAVVAARALASAGPSGAEALRAALGEAAANYCATFEDWRLGLGLPDSGIWSSDGSIQLPGTGAMRTRPGLRQSA